MEPQKNSPAPIPKAAPKDAPQDPALLNNARSMLDRRFRALIEHSSDVIALFGADMTVLYDSPSIEKVLGYKPEEHVGRNAIEFLHPDEKEFAIQTLGTILQHPMESTNMEMRVQHKDGHFIWVELVVTNMLNEPDVKAIVINYRDVTARKLIQEQLANKNKALEEANIIIAEARAKDEAILASMGEGLVTTDTEGKIITWNQQMESMFGYTAPEVMGKEMMKMVDAIDEDGNIIPVEERALSKVYAGAKRASAKYYYKGKNDKIFPVAVTSAPYLRDGKVAGVVSIIRDITEELAIEKAKDEFVTLVSHELRTPLTVIRWHLNGLMKRLGDLKLDAAALRSVNFMFMASVTMREIIEATLAVSKLELNKLFINLQTINFLDTIASTLNEFTVQATNKQIHIKTELPTEKMLITGDPTLTQIIFQNLVSNAIKYTPQGGDITIKAETLNNTTTISVKDSGCGIPPEEQAKIFTKLYRATNAKAIEPNGMGLALYISKIGAQRMNGDIWFETQVNKGTTFYFKIPTAKEEVETVPVQSAKVAQ